MKVSFIELFIFQLLFNILYCSAMNSRKSQLEYKRNKKHTSNIVFKKQKENKEIEKKSTVAPVIKDEKILNDAFKEIEPTLIQKIDTNLENEKNVEENNIKNINIYKNDNITINNKLEKKNSNSDSTIFNEGNFGNILIKESKETSGVESDDDIIDESEINYTSNCT